MSSKTPSRVTFRLVTSLIAPWRRLLAVIVVTVLAWAALQPVQPLLTKTLFDKHLVRGRMDGVLAIALLYLAASALAQVLKFATTYLTAIASQGALHDLRVRLFAHLQKLPMSYFDRTPLGDSISRCTADVETIDTLFTSGVVSALQNMTSSVSIFVVMLLLSPMLTAISAISIIPVILVTNILRIRIREAERATRLAVGAMNTDLQETLGGVEVIRAFGREKLFVSRFRVSLRQTLNAFNRSTITSAADVPIMALLSALTMAALIYAASTRAFPTWHVSIGTFVAFLQLLKRFFDPITALGEDWQTVQSALSGTERIFQVLLTPEDIPDSVARPAESGANVVELRDIVFGYREGRPVLHGVSVEVRAGEHVALVGRTGAGKSSILHLIGGLYPAWDGTVRIAGHDPRQIDEIQRRDFIGVVPQNVQLFSGSVLDNLTLGDRGAPREAAQRAAQITGADTFVQSLPKGYDTVLSDLGRGTGVHLSSGQRQLLALARALVWDPKVLLLDEATAAIDHASEADFREALQEQVLDRGRAVITVAHRLATAREADRVIVLDRGRIIEQGTPEELISAGGHFAAWLELEAAGWDWHTEPDLSPPYEGGAGEVGSESV
jgi:ATP-binding cassette subfamily B multidrug efflux pump